MGIIRRISSWFARQWGRRASAQAVAVYDLAPARPRACGEKGRDASADAHRTAGRALTACMLGVWCTVGSLSCDSARGASPVAEVVSQVSVAKYHGYLWDDLYTHKGDDRSCLGSQHDLAMQKIRQRFESFGLAAGLGPPFPTCGRWNYNVVAVHAGKVCPEEIYLVGAHYDTAAGSPGAWDNASGVAGVLEAARVLSRYTFEASIVFVAFDREEEGRKGSDAYVQEHRQDRIRGMIALDGIAYRPYPFGNQDYSKVGLYYQSVRTKLVDALAVAMKSGAGLTCVIAREDLTDNTPFDRFGFAAAALVSRSLAVDGAPPFMHKPSDSVDTPGCIDYSYGAQVTRGVVAFLATQARRTSIRALPDFNGDGWVDLRDYALLARYWGQSRALFDISPSPTDDGIVGFEDLAGLSYYWLNRWSNWWPDFVLPARPLADGSEGEPTGKSTGR
jgi:hypothetical protein